MKSHSRNDVDPQNVNTTKQQQQQQQDEISSSALATQGSATTKVSGVRLRQFHAKKSETKPSFAELPPHVQQLLVPLKIFLAMVFGDPVRTGVLMDAWFCESKSLRYRNASIEPYQYAENLLAVVRHLLNHEFDFRVTESYVELWRDAPELSIAFTSLTEPEQRALSVCKVTTQSLFVNKKTGLTNRTELSGFCFNYMLNEFIDRRALATFFVGVISQNLEYSPAASAAYYYHTLVHVRSQLADIASTPYAKIIQEKRHADAHRKHGMRARSALEIDKYYRTPLAKFAVELHALLSKW